MVRRVFSLINKEFGGLHQAAFLLALFSFLSQLLSLCRDRLLAGRFGAGLELDIYYTAFRLPDLVYVSIASFVSVTVLIPFIVNKIEINDTQAVKKFLDSVFTAFFAVMALVSLILFFLIPLLAPFLAPGFSPSALDQLIVLTRILLLSPFLLGLSNLLGSVTQSFKRFLVYTLSPVLYNIGIILGILFFEPIWGLPGLAWGVILGAWLHFFIQVPSVWRLGLLPKIHFYRPFPWKNLGQVILISLPRTITLAVHQFSLLALVAIGSTITAGAITVFNMAYNLQAVPLVIVGISYSVAAFPTLTGLLAGNRKIEFVDQMTSVIRHIIFWSVPATILFIVLRAQIVRVILGTGEFSWSDTRLTAAALALFVFSVTAQSLVLLFVRAYYAAGMTKKPLIVNSASSVLIIFLALGLKYMFEQLAIIRHFFEILLRVENVPGTAVLMLPLAFSLGLFINVLIFWYLFRKDFGDNGLAVHRTLGQSLAAGLIIGFVAYGGLQLGSLVFDKTTFWGILLQGLVAGLIAIGIGVATLYLLGSFELKEFMASAKSRFWKIRPIVVESEEI